MGSNRSFSKKYSYIKKNKNKIKKYREAIPKWPLRKAVRKAAKMSLKLRDQKVKAIMRELQ